MVLAIVLAVASLIGIVYGITKKSKKMAILSSIALAVITCMWIYFYNNPY